jgi:hypothetical protein
MNVIGIKAGLVSLLFLVLIAGCEKNEPAQATSVESDKVAVSELTDEQVKNIVRRSYQYVALYNVINKGALNAENPTSTGGFNKMNVATALYDHNVKIIARPNNDSLYIAAMLDLRKEPVVLDMPAFDSKYVSLMAVAYDHYVNVPLTTRKGDFRKPEKALFYSARTEGYSGEPVEGIDRVFEMSGDFVIAVFRVMPHANEPEKFNKIVEQMKTVKLLTLSEFNGGAAKSIDDISFPAYGNTDADVFGDNFLEVMQFVFNHTTFDPADEMDQGVLAAFKPLAIEPGKVYDAAKAMKIDGERFRKMSQQVQKENLALLTQPEKFVSLAPRILQSKGKTDIEAMVVVSVIGPIGLPMEEATYPNVATVDGSPMNAQNDYVIRMTKEQMPPATAFWSMTLYDSQNGFFIPNDHKKYSVGENAGMKINAEGGIDVYVAAEQPEGVPVENWLPINRQDENLDIILRIYVPDLEKFQSWSAPKAEMITKK